MRRTVARVVAGLGALLAMALGVCVLPSFSVTATALPVPPRIGLPLSVTGAGADMGDPYVLTVPPSDGHRGFYVAFATANWDERIPVAVSDDLVDWQQMGDALPGVPGWADPDPQRAFTWAPAVVRMGDHWSMYYTLRTRSGLQCISVATSTDPIGPYVDHSTGPLVCQASLDGSIDPSPTQTPYGWELLWKSTGGLGTHEPAQIWGQLLSADGFGLVGKRIALLRPTQRWQAWNVEAPNLVYLRGTWWLLYSGSDWQSRSYSTGAAWCLGPMGPCQTYGKAPILQSNGALYGPGGMQTFTTLNGRPMAVFHSWPANGWRRQGRELVIAPIS